jgi:O-glycosyl hydrolase
MSKTCFRQGIGGSGMAVHGARDRHRSDPQRYFRVPSICGGERWWVVFAVGILLGGCCLCAQDLNFSASRVEVDFSRKLQPWDGFGFNYVETAQTMDYRDDPQEYGGFSLLAETDRLKIIELVFGDDGLKVGLLKMFHDPFHQTAAGRPYDHQTTTKYLRYFAREGLKQSRASGRDLTIITTLYGPPGYMTKQKVLRGRDLDPARKNDLVEYLVSWVRFLREKEGLPVKYVSLHNEGEDWSRWTRAGLTDNPGHDYNLFWPPEQVVEFIKRVHDRLQQAGISEVRVTPGETTNWYRWGAWGYADAIAADPEALAKLGLITSHGFYAGGYGRWFGEHQSAGTDRLRALRPELRAWVTSTSWSKMDAQNIKEHHGNIYSAKVNGIIPWAGIQRPSKWVGGDPNPGSAFTVREDGVFEVRRGYYFYKQVSRAGQPGMAVVQTSAMDSELAILGFASNGTANRDAFVVVNLGRDKTANLRIKGSTATRFQAYRTTEDETDRYAAIGEFGLEQGNLAYQAPGGSVTTFFATE